MNTHAVNQTVAHEGWMVASRTGFMNASDDEKIDLYAHYRKARNEEIKQDIDNTISRAIKFIESFEEKLLEQTAIRIEDAFIRINGNSDASALILVSKEDFLKTEFLTVYDIASDVEAKAAEFKVLIDFNFATKTENTNDNKIASDGFVLKRQAINTDGHSR